MAGALASVLLLAGTTASATASGNLILTGGAVYTLDPARPWASSVVVADGRIAYVGNDAGARAYIGRNSRILRLHGRMVLPGFHDAHAHPMSGAMRFLRCRLNDARTALQVYGIVKACAAAAPHARWLVGYGWPQQLFRKDRAYLRVLDALVPDRPAYLATEEGFSAWVNSRALAAAGINSSGAAQKLDGLNRDPRTGKPSGIVEGDVLELVHRRIPPPSEEEYRKAFRTWQAAANAFGITSVFDASATEAMLEAYHAADLAGELSVRVVAAQLVDGSRPELIDAMIARRDRMRGARFRADAAKLFLDGEFDLHTAALLAPYADAAASRGQLLVQPDVLDGIVRRLDAEGFLVHMHAMGDRAVRAGLDAVARTEAANSARDRRHQIAHAALVDRADLPRFGALGVSANLQPMWFQADDPAMSPSKAALGPMRASQLYPAASIAAAGGRIVMSSDWPATSANPLDAIQVAVTRRPLDGDKPAERPRERMDLASSIAAYTRNAAYVAREDSIDGTIAVGKAADLVVLDRNLFTCKPLALHKARVLLTLLDGEPVFRSPLLAQ